MLTKRIFLASSDELREDRIAFELMLGQLNQEWVPRGTFFHLVVWENFIDAMSKDGLQKEYNRVITECDIFVLLFFTKVGKYTSEEFEAAFGSFSSAKKPLVYTYFKDAVILTGDIDDSIFSLLEFKKRLSTLNHYCTRYRSSEELKWLFSRQLDKLFGDSLGLSLDIVASTPQSQIDTVALALVNRYLSELDGRTTVDEGKLKKSIEKSSEISRHTIFLLAQQVRKSNWVTDKAVMQRTIPIFEALIAADTTKHYYFAQLAYAKKDQINPDWAGSSHNIDRAFELLHDGELDQFPYYHLCRAACLIELDVNFRHGRASDKATKKAVLNNLRAFSPSFPDFTEFTKQSWNLSYRRWLSMNESQPK
jgi:hypothetical protein